MMDLKEKKKQEHKKLFEIKSTSQVPQNLHNTLLNTDCESQDGPKKIPHHLPPDDDNEKWN